nr:hypothetical protein [Tanacetum cinerariifolium]
MGLVKHSTLFSNVVNVTKKSEESLTDLIERAKLQFHEDSSTGNKKLTLEHACRVLKEYAKWDATDPANPIDLTELFDDDARPRPAGKPRPAKKTNRRGRRAPREVGYFIRNFAFRTQAQAGSREKAYEARKQKDLAIMECKELEFLTINTDGMPKDQAAIINCKKQQIIKKFA